MPKKTSDSDESDSDLSSGESEAEPISRKNSFVVEPRELHSSIMQELKAKGILRKLSMIQ